MNKRLVLLVTSFLLLSSLTIFFCSNTVKAVAFNGYYYGYGDSNMMGNNCDITDLDEGNDTFTEYMQWQHEPTNTSVDAVKEGEESDWGLANYDTYVTNAGWYVFEAFGVNDVAHDTDIGACASNKMAMYNKSVNDGADEHYYPCIWQLIDPSHNSNRVWATWGWTYEQKRQYQEDFMHEVEDLFKGFGVEYIPYYDAIDTVPYNGQVDDYTTDYSCGGGHYNKEGLFRIANFCWKFVNAEMYDKTWNNALNQFEITAYYNYTIQFDLPTGWNYSNITVTCTTNSTTINSFQSTHPDGTDMFYVQVKNGSSYEITGDTTTGANVKPQFIFIQESVNNSYIYDMTPIINWTRVSDTSQYWLRIDDNSDFSSPEVNLTDINQWNYPSNYAINTTRVSFTLPDAYALSKKTYYFEVYSYNR